VGTGKQNTAKAPPHGHYSKNMLPDSKTGCKMVQIFYKLGTMQKNTATAHENAENVGLADFFLNVIKLSSSRQNIKI